MSELMFVCWGNICRSPMAERVARKRFEEAGLQVRTSSSGTSTEELGNPIDRRAARTLREHGYDAEDHRAHQVTREEIERADLVVAMEDIHIDRIEAIARGGDTDHVVLLSSFDPRATPGEGVPDPWYGGQDGFENTLDMIERAMPGLVEAVRKLS